MEIMSQGKSTGMMPAEEMREMTEVKAKIYLAKQFPRDTVGAEQNIFRECENEDLAESATYEYPRGNETVTGPSIRLVEVVARYWGNMSSGVRELSRTKRPDGVEVATVRAYAWDQETNFTDEKVFDVPLVRNTKKGTYPLHDSRDQYELIANMGARRKRSCMQAVIPRWIIDKAVEHCAETLTNKNDGQSIDDKKASMLKAFQKFADWITMETLGAYVGKEPDKIGVKDLSRLRRLYTAIEDGFTKPETAFGKQEPVQSVEDDRDAARDLLGDVLGDKQ